MLGRMQRPLRPWADVVLTECQAKAGANQMIVGMERDEAVAALSHLGTATIDLWPAWVSTIPDRSWRVEIEVIE